MRVVCPSCNAAYNVPEASLSGSARRLRCARCQTEWTVEPPPPETSVAAGDRAGPMARMVEASLAERATDVASPAAAPPYVAPPSVTPGSVVAVSVPAEAGPTHPSALDHDGGGASGLAPPFAPDASGMPSVKPEGTFAPLVADTKLPVSHHPEDGRSGGRRGPELPTEDRLAADARARVRARSATSTGNIVLAWLLSLAVLALCVAAAVIWRKEVVRAWPPSERAYLWLGLR